MLVSTTRRPRRSTRGEQRTSGLLHARDTPSSTSHPPKHSHRFSPSQTVHRNSHTRLSAHWTTPSSSSSPLLPSKKRQKSPATSLRTSMSPSHPMPPAPHHRTSTCSSHSATSPPQAKKFTTQAQPATPFPSPRAGFASVYARRTPTTPSTVTTCRGATTSAQTYNQSFLATCTVLMSRCGRRMSLSRRVERLCSRLAVEIHRAVASSSMIIRRIGARRSLRV